jgi:prepilin-type N-terminal cleavage/methylation domain-containing protein
MRTRGRTIRTGFTLIELVLVMLVITIAVGVAVPELRGWNRGARMSDTVDQVITLARLARTEAISTAQVHRMTIDPAGRCYVSKQDGEQFVELGEGRDASFVVPDGVKLQMTDLQGGPRDFVEFYPNGRMQTARIRVSMEDGGYEKVIEAATSTEGFRVPAAGGTR